MRFVALILLCGFFSLTVGLRLSPRMSAQSPDAFSRFKNALQKIVNPKIVATAVCCALVAASPGDVSAAPSGSRTGGSSFRSSSRGDSNGRSSTRLNSYSSSYRSTSVMPPPIFSPFPMFSPFSYGFGISPTVVMPLNANIVLLAGAAYLAYNILLSRAGGANFFKSGETGSLGSGATVVKIQLSLDSDWSQPDNIMETLGKLSSGNSRDRGLLTGRTELSTLLSETALALLRRKDAWSAAALAGERFTGGDDVAQRVEPFFQSAVVQERSKFEAEVAPSHGTMNSDSNSNSKEYNTDQDFMGRTATQMLVSLVVALRGRSEVLSARPAAVTSAEVARCLQTLASEALSDEGENVLGVEVLWTPSERGRTLSSKDLLLEYPELMSL